MKAGALSILILFLLAGANTWAREPSIEEVRQETIRHLGIDQHEIDSWKKKSRLSAALPRLQLGFDRDLKDVVSLTTKDSVSVAGGDVFVGPSENNFDQNFNQGTSFQVRALWYLNELIFNRDTLAASHEQREWFQQKVRALQEVSAAYFTRLRLKQELKMKKDKPEMREKKKLLVDQAEGTLNAYTDGWFFKEMRYDKK